MNFNLTVNESGSAQLDDLGGVATHNIRVHYNEQDAGHVTGPFTLSGARQAAIVAIGRTDVISVSIEEVE